MIFGDLLFFLHKSVGAFLSCLHCHLYLIIHNFFFHKRCKEYNVFHYSLRYTFRQKWTLWEKILNSKRIITHTKIFHSVNFDCAIGSLTFNSVTKAFRIITGVKGLLQILQEYNSCCKVIPFVTRVQIAAKKIVQNMTILHKRKIQNGLI